MFFFFSVLLLVSSCFLNVTDSSNLYINSLVCRWELESLCIILIIWRLSTFLKCLPELVVSLASLNKATGPKLTSAISSLSVYLVSFFFTTQKFKCLYEFCKQLYVSSLGKLIQILEIISLIVGNL